MSWAIGVLLFAAGVRAVVEVVALLGATVVPSFAVGLRRGLEIGQRVIYYVGIPVWIALRLLS